MTTIALLASLILPTNAPFTKYEQYLGPTSLSSKTCALGSQLKDGSILSQFAVTDTDPYVQDLTLTSDLTLTTVDESVTFESGSECAYFGFPEHDPDFRCNASTQGKWAVVQIKLNDTAGNEWFYTNQTMFYAADSFLPHEQVLRADTEAKMQHDCTSL